MKKQTFAFLFLLIFANAFSMEKMEVMKKWAHKDDKPNFEIASNPYYEKVTDLIAKDEAFEIEEDGISVGLIAFNKAICFFSNIDDKEENSDILGRSLPDTPENNALKQQAQDLFQTALTTVYREAQKGAPSKTDIDDSKTVSKPDQSSKK